VTGYALGQASGYGRSFQSVVRGVNPAAGASFSLTLDSRWVWRCVSAVFTLTTDANVANRYVTMEATQDDGASYAVSAPAVVFTAGGTARYVGSISQGVGEWNTGTDAFFHLAPVWMFGGSILTITVGSIQVGDTLTKIRFVFDRVPSDAENVPGFES
jgi:hypothetical protein